MCNLLKYEKENDNSNETTPVLMYFLLVLFYEHIKLMWA